MVKRMMAATSDDTVERWRALHVEGLRLAQRLREAAAVFRQYAGELRYHPQTGVEGHIGQDLLDAAAAFREVLAAIAGMAVRWDDEVAWLLSLDAHMMLDDVQNAHVAVRDAVRLVGAALDIFEQAVLHPETATLDAPYGHGAPRRVHPGAQCTWVAERAEELAVALSSVTLRKANILLTLRVE